MNQTDCSVRVDTRVDPTLGRPLAVREDGLEALPVGQGAKRRVGGHEVVQMGRPRPRQAADDDRPLDRDPGDLRMAPHDILDAQAVLEQGDDEGVLAGEAGGAQPPFGAQRRAQHVEALAEPGITEVVETGLGDRRAHHCLWIETEVRLPPRSSWR